MSQISYSQILKVLSSEREEIEQLPRLNVTILPNITIEPFKPYLAYFAYQLGFHAEISLGEYDNIYQEAVGNQSELISRDTDFVIVFMRLEGISWDLARNFSALNRTQIEEEKTRIGAYVAEAMNGIRQNTDATILWHGFDGPLNPALGVLDYQNANGQTATVEALNNMLKAELQQLNDAHFVDLNLALMRLGSEEFYDQRYWHIAKAPYSRKALMQLASENMRFVSARVGKNKKCLVLDCDNVLWGGVLGEEDIAGIELSRVHPGSAFFEFQQEVLNLYHRGVIVSLCSKNDAEVVWQVFREHPDMLLREEHIACARINWNDKSTNIRAIAEELNIGLDSIVFVDDNLFEINFIRETLPEVTLIHLPAERAYCNREVLASCGYFDTVTLTEEDRARGKLYKAEATRKSLQAEQPSLQSYLESLGMVVEIDFADPVSIPRIAQLTQKTNQFNLTTRRYTEAEIDRLAADADADVVSLTLRDKVGEMGLIGVGILKYDAESAHIDTMLVSCRALGREVEDVFLSECLTLAQERGCKAAIGYFAPTRKNGQTADFYTRRGFQVHRHSEDEKSFIIGLSDFKRQRPACFAGTGAVLNSTVTMLSDGGDQ